MCVVMGDRMPAGRHNGSAVGKKYVSGNWKLAVMDAIDVEEEWTERSTFRAHHPQSQLKPQ